MALDINKVEKFLSSLKKFYQPEDPQKKDGIGHENEHIKGVIRRTTQICRTINEHPEVYGKKVDPVVAATIACLHDVGNLVARDGHNFFGEAIFDGRLTAKHIVKHMYEQANIEERRSMSKIVSKLENGDIDMYDVDAGLTPHITEAYCMVAKFHMAMYGFNGETVTPENVKGFLADILPNKSVQETVLRVMMDESGNKFKGEFNISYNPELQEIGREFHEVFKGAQMVRNQVLSGIREHNVDFEKVDQHKERFISEHMYSRIIADADKDNVAETFAMRTMLYAENVFGKAKGKFILVIDGEKQYDEHGEPKIDVDKVCRHVLHQARERFGYSREEWEALVGKHVGPQPIFREAYEQLDAEGYKPIWKAKFYRKDIPAKDGWGKDGMFDKSTPESEYVGSARGDDIFSQLDAGAEKDARERRNTLAKNGVPVSELPVVEAVFFVSDLRTEALEKCRNWSRVDMEQQSLEELREIYEILQGAPSIEAAVDVVEGRFYHSDDMSFEAAVAEALGLTPPPSLALAVAAQAEYMNSLVINVNEKELEEEYDNSKGKGVRTPNNTEEHEF